MTGWWDLDGRSVLVAGCGGIGRGCLDALLAEGARVFAVDADPATVDKRGGPGRLDSAAGVGGAAGADDVAGRAGHRRSSRWPSPRRATGGPATSW